MAPLWIGTLPTRAADEGKLAVATRATPNPALGHGGEDHDGT